MNARTPTPGKYPTPFWVQGTSKEHEGISGHIAGRSIRRAKAKGHSLNATRQANQRSF